MSDHLFRARELLRDVQNNKNGIRNGVEDDLLNASWHLLEHLLEQESERSMDFKPRPSGLIYLCDEDWQPLRAVDPWTLPDRVTMRLLDGGGVGVQLSLGAPRG